MKLREETVARSHARTNAHSRARSSRLHTTTEDGRCRCSVNREIRIAFFYLAKIFKPYLARIVNRGETKRNKDDTNTTFMLYTTYRYLLSILS